MLELLPTLIVGLALAFVSQYRTTNDGLLVMQKKKDFAVYLIMAVVMVMFAGLRVKYNDTSVYIYDYIYGTPSAGNFFIGMKWTLSESVGYRILNRIMKRLAFNSQTFVMVYAIIDIGIPLWFIRKYAEGKNFFLTMFLFVTMGVYLFNFAAIMQCTATALALVAVDKVIEKKWFWFAFFIVLATSFHTYAFIFVLTPLLTFQPWSQKTYYMLGGFLIIGLLLPNLMGLVVSVTDALGESYDLNEFTQAGVNIFRFLVVAVPVVLSFMTRKQSIGSTTRTENLIINLCMLNAEIMFVALFGTANYFARLANYFLLFQAVALPILLRYFDKRTRDLLLAGIYVCYTIYFIYSNVGAYAKSFDDIYESITIVQYLKIIYNRLFFGGM
ncbi:MAG: EpsG family protein [Clostridia bacterium]|nr:EpsG family protein [Clostridia bacterium]